MDELRGYDAQVRLLEREHELGVLARGLRQVAQGPGVGIALAGDAGTGKSSTVLAALHDAAGLRVLRGQCDPLGTPRPLGPLREVGLAALEGVASAEAYQLSETAEAVLRELALEPTVLVIEDLHWADAASTDVLRYVVRRVETVPLAVLLTYRDVEIGPRHPARQLLGDFASLDGLCTLSLRPLSVAGVEAVVDGTGLDAARVHELTGGNPFYVSQVALEPDRPLPTTVRDTVLARTADIEAADLEVLQMVACSPDGLDDRVLPIVGVDLDILHRLDRTTLLVRTATGIAFRHELARQAVETTIPLGGSPRLHERLLTALEQVAVRDPATMTHHAIAARDTARTLTYSRSAAAEALATASHVEAASFLEVALEHLPTSAAPEERASLLIQLTLQLYLTARLREAFETARASIPLWSQAGRMDGVAEAHAALAVLEYQSAHRDSSDRHSEQACALAIESNVPATIALVHRDAGQIALVGSKLDHARACGAITMSAGREAGVRELVIAGEMLQASVDAFLGDERAHRRVHELVTTARQNGWDELAWRGYVTIVVALMEQGRLREALDAIEETIAHVTDRDLSTQRLWHVSLRSVVHAWSGRWSAAREDAESVIATGALDGSQWPHLALAVVSTRTGGDDAGAHLDRAWTVACGIDDPMRYLPVLRAMAEQSWLTGVIDPRITGFAVPRLHDLASTGDTRWGIGHLLVWMRRLGIDVDVPGDVPEPFASHLAGRHAEAAAWCRRVGSPFSEAMALADSPDPDDRVRAVTGLDRLGATGSADRLRRELRADGVLFVPKRPNGASRANPGGLTNRQLEVARLLARGMTNAEIADLVFISPKTAEHHVSAVLGKLGLPNRRAVVRAASELGLA